MNNAVFVWTIGDVFNLIVLFLFFVFAVIPISIILIKIELRKFFCKHEKYGFYESSKCDAICINCGKNLGFIGTVKEQRRKLAKRERETK